MKQIQAVADDTTIAVARLTILYSLRDERNGEACICQ